MLTPTFLVSNSFARYCHQAKEVCALYREGDNTEAIHDRLFGILDSLKDNPITAIDPASKQPIIINHSDIKLFIFTTLYAPVYGFIAVAYIFDLLYRGEREWLGQALAPGYAAPSGAVCQAPLPAWAYPSEAQAAIMCSDKRYPVSHAQLRPAWIHLTNKA